MSHLLQAQLFGHCSILLDKKPVARINLPRLQVLFAYLLLNHNTPLLRSNVSYRLWPDSSETQARTNLRNLLHLLRKALPDCDQYLHIDNQLIQWLPEIEFNLDVDCFEAELSRANHFESQEDLNRCRLSLENAVAVYKGDLLPDCYADWVIFERERLSQSFLQALERLIVLLENQRNYHKAIAYVLDLLRFDPLQESAYRQLMRLHLLTGNRAEAITAYHTCAAVLQRELSVKPSPVTHELYQRILKAGPQPDSLTDLKPAPGRLPLIGRQTEWEMLQSAWQKTCAGEACFFLLKGENGLGKTYLANEWLSWARRQGISAAHAHCHPEGGILEYAPVAKWLGALKLPVMDAIYQSELARLLPDILTRDPSLPHPQPLTESWQRQRLLEAMVRALLGVEFPLVLILDNLQECDARTLEFMRLLLSTHPGAPIMILATLRSEDDTQRSDLAAFLKDIGQMITLVEVELAPLGKSQTASLAEALSGRALEPAQADAIFQETEGNPLVITELVRARVENHRTPADDGPQAKSGPLNLPLAIRQAFEERLARLSPAAYSLAGIAAAIGLNFSYETLKNASGLDEGRLVDSLDELFQRRILVDQNNGSYRFSHIKLHEMIYSSLSTARRNWYQRRIAEIDS